LDRVRADGFCLDGCGKIPVEWECDLLPRPDWRTNICYGDSRMTTLTAAQLANVFPVRTTLQLLNAGALIGGILACGGGALRAAPIALRFEATISKIANGSPFNVPLIYQIGDEIEGAFFFDPEIFSPIGDNAAGSLQSNSIHFEIGGQTIGTSSYLAQISDDVGVSHSPYSEDVVDLVRFSAGIHSLPGLPSPVPDVISLPGGDPFRLRFLLSLYGAKSSLDSAELDSVGLLAMLNSLAFERSLTINFNALGTGSVGFDATLSQFVIVPEPGSAIHTIGLAIALLCRVRPSEKEPNILDPLIEEFV
jgi:hypothetical protein